MAAADKQKSSSKKENKVLWSDRKRVLWFPIGLAKYTVREDERIYIDRGLFSTVSDQTWLYRVTDIQMSRSCGQKICGTGTIVMVSKVDADHEIVLKNIKKPREVLTMLSDLIEKSRQKRQVVGTEFYSRGCGLPHDHMHGHGTDMDGDGFID